MDRNRWNTEDITDIVAVVFTCSSSSGNSRIYIRSLGGIV